MQIGLIAEKYIDGDLDHNFSQLRKWLNRCAGKGFDLLCFGESFAHGFESLTWNHEQDLKIALTQKDAYIEDIRAAAENAQTGIAFGYFEKCADKLYSSYLVISASGKQLANFRRVSPGWKKHIADPEFYLEGNDYTSFELGGKAFGIAICGDLWYDNLLENFQVQKADLLLWPLFINYTPEDWFGSERGSYAERVQGLNRPVLMVNSLSEPPNQALGGCYVFNSGRIEKELSLGESGLLSFQI